MPRPHKHTEKTQASSKKLYIKVDQKARIDELAEIEFDKSSTDSVLCSPQMHTTCKSVLGQINWLQSRTRPHICYFFSRCASAAASPTIGDVRKLNKLVRTIKATPVELKFWPL